MTLTVREGRVTAQVRYKGVSIAQTFDLKEAAKRWQTAVRAAIDVREWPQRHLVPRNLWHKWGLDDGPVLGDGVPHVSWPLGRALEQYDKTVTSKKKGWKQEHNRIEQWRKRPLADKSLAEVTVRELQEHVGARLAAGRAANTIRNEMFLLSAMFEHARASDNDHTGTHGWGLTSLVNPIPSLVLPPPPNPRNRRLEDAPDDTERGEEERLRDAIASGPDGETMRALFVFAIETGMRLGEILDVRVGQIKKRRGTRFIVRPDSKGGDPRRVVLSTRAVAAIDTLLGSLPPDVDPEARVFMLDVPQVEYRWKLARKTADVDSLRWHDLRHEGLSRMADAGLTVGELKAQSGHRTAQVLLDYINATPSAVARKLG